VPNPPRVLFLSSLTSSHSGWEIFTKVPCAMRSPFSTVTGLPVKL